MTSMQIPVTPRMRCRSRLWLSTRQMPMTSLRLSCGKISAAFRSWAGVRSTRSLSGQTTPRFKRQQFPTVHQFCVEVTNYSSFRAEITDIIGVAAHDAAVVERERRGGRGRVFGVGLSKVRSHHIICFISDMISHVVWNE